MPTATPQQLLSKELEVIKVETAPVIARANSLQVVDTQSYALADTFLDKLVAARKTVKTRLAKILDPLKEALKEAQGLLREVDTPLEQAEISVRDAMKCYKLEEARQARIADEKRQAEADRLRREADAKALLESKAKTQQMRDKLAAQRAELETKADVAESAPAPVAVRAANSTTRNVRVPVVTNLAEVLKDILAGQIPLDVVKVDLVAVRSYYKQSPAEVEQWHGIEFVDDIQIVKR